MRSKVDYLESLKKMRPNIYKFGELIHDVTTHPATRRTVTSHSRVFELADSEEYKDLFTTTSFLTNKRIMRFNSLMTTLHDIMANAEFKRTMYRLTGTCTGGLCVGWNCINTMWAVTYEMDAKLGTNYHERLKNWLLDAEDKGLVVAGALTDAKGNRAKKPCEQNNPDKNLRIVEENEEGIVVSGCKAMICGVAASEEIFVLPGAVYKADNRNYAVAFVIPRDADGLTIIEARRPSDSREYEEGFDIPETGITQSYLLFDKVFIPRERVFMAGEFEFTSRIIEYFTANYRACIGACVAGQGDVMVGAAVLMARANGLSSKIFKDKILQMILNNETTYGLGIGAMALGKRHPSSVWIADSISAHTNKVLVATLPYETKRLCQEIGGGVVETGCLPSYMDIMDPLYGGKLREYLTANEEVSGVSRAKIARLVEWLTIGAGVPGCMHGGGSPDGARLVVYGKTPLEKYAAYAKNIAGIKEDIREPENKK